MPKTTKSPADYVLPLNMNGLSGRMLRLPPPNAKRKEMLFVYGHHSSLERLFGMAEYLNKDVGVTIPDLPGFGGMDPFYKIGEKPTLDNMADYLAAFIKFRYKKQKFSIVGLSLGFMIVARMLQKYPELSKQVELLISFAGFTNKKDFRYKKSTYLFFRYASSFFSRRLPAAFVKYCVLRGPFIRLGYTIGEPVFISNDNSKIRGTDEQQRRERIEFEVHLWQCNDVRTYMDIAVTMFTLNLQKFQHVDLTVNHLAVDADRYFDNLSVEQHMRQIFKDFKIINAKVPAHSPSVIATAAEAEPYIKPFSNLLKKLR